jgi:hypothetical protein
MTNPVSETKPAKLVTTLTYHVETTLIFVDGISTSWTHFAVSFYPFHITRAFFFSPFLDLIAACWQMIFLTTTPKAKFLFTLA